MNNNQLVSRCQFRRADGTCADGNCVQIRSSKCCMDCKIHHCYRRCDQSKGSDTRETD